MNMYDQLEHAYHRALNVCDPIEYAYRQQYLLFTVVNYLLDRDRPPLMAKLDTASLVREMDGDRCDPKLLE